MPVYSTVLRMKEGYRDLFMLYFKYLSAFKFSKLLHYIISMRNLPMLYEIWVALELTEKIMEITQEYERMLVKKLTIDIKEESIPPSFTLELQLENGKKFKYQTEREAYTGILLRPDFVFYTNNSIDVILDAKFSWYEGGGTRPKDGDIVKMHAYRDALRAKACYIIYPYGQDYFFGVNYRNNEKKLDEIIKNWISNKEISKGVGWIKMVPKVDKKGGGINGRKNNS